jgi:hypothetical protein
MWIFTLIGILVVALIVISLLPFLTPLLVWIIGIVIFLLMLVLAYLFLAALLPIIAIGFLVWIIYSAVKGWKKK